MEWLPGYRRETQLRCCLSTRCCLYTRACLDLSDVRWVIVIMIVLLTILGPTFWLASVSGGTQQLHLPGIVMSAVAALLVLLTFTGLKFVLMGSLNPEAPDGYRNLK